MKKTPSIDKDRDQRILELLPEMQRRYQRLQEMMAIAKAGGDIPDSEFWLAQNDLYSVLEVMTLDPDDTTLSGF